MNLPLYDLFTHFGKNPGFWEKLCLCPHSLKINMCLPWRPVGAFLLKIGALVVDRHRVDHIRQILLKWFSKAAIYQKHTEMNSIAKVRRGFTICSSASEKLPLVYVKYHWNSNKYLSLYPINLPRSRTTHFYLNSTAWISILRGEHLSNEYKRNCAF